MRRVSIFLAVVLSFTGFVRADAPTSLKLPAIFGDHMVLQRNVPAPVWGWATPGEKVVVSFMNQSKEATAGADGKWMVKLDSLTAGGPSTLTISGKTSLAIKDVLVGEVWLASGQSNMEFGLRGATGGEAAAKASANPNIRLFNVSLKKKPAATPQSDLEATWTPCEQGEALKFSAVAYYFGRELQKELNVPVGLIHSSWGGTPIEYWLNEKAMKADTDMAVAYANQEKAVAAYPAAQARYKEQQAKYQEQLAAYKTAAENAKAEGKPAPAAPRPPQAPRNPNQMPPACLYNGMIAPMVPYAIGGVIWYQGESNANNAALYRKQMPAMIRQWRLDFACGEFPFLMVQLANFMDRTNDPVQSGWAELREAQLMTTKNTPKTGEAVIIDIGEAKDIHPKNKEDVGKRLALAALGIGYGKKIEFSGPIYDSMKVDGSKVRLNFAHVGSGLMARDGELKGFAIAGEDQQFHFAQAQIDGDSIIVSSKDVSTPKAVRYAWANNPDCNLYNKEGLPATPFRTDDWTKASAAK